MSIPPSHFPTSIAWPARPPSLLGLRDDATVQAERWMLAYLLIHLLLWTVLPALSHSAPPWDNIEQLVWLQSWEWGYYKHPPAPTWWMHVWTTLLGRSVWASFFAAQLSVVLMLYGLWRMGLLLTTPARAFAAVVLTSLIAYHGLRGIMANHNTLQLLPVVLLLWSALLAVREGGGWRWVLVGAAAGLCMLTKYTALLWFAALGLWWLGDSRMRKASAWGGVAIALTVCMLLVAPHVGWLVRHGFASVDYARHAIGDEGGLLAHALVLLHFVVTQLLRLLPFLAGTVLVVSILRRSGARAPAPAIGEAKFLVIVGLTPLLLTFGVGLSGAHLDASWATTFFVLFGLLALRWLPDASPPALFKTCLAVGLGLQLLMSGGLAIGRGWLVDVMGRQARSNFPAQALANALEASWHEHMTTPLRVVSGETWLAGNVSLHAVSQPLVLIDGNPERAPWVSASTIEASGMLVVVDESADEAAPAAVKAQLAHALYQGTVHLPWGRNPSTPELHVAWGIVPAGHSGFLVPAAVSMPSPMKAAAVK